MGGMRVRAVVGMSLTVIIKVGIRVSLWKSKA